MMIGEDNLKCAPLSYPNLAPLTVELFHFYILGFVVDFLSIFASIFRVLVYFDIVK